MMSAITQANPSCPEWSLPPCRAWSSQSLSGDSCRSPAYTFPQHAPATKQSTSPPRRRCRTTYSDTLHILRALLTTRSSEPLHIHLRLRRIILRRALLEHVCRAIGEEP